MSKTEKRDDGKYMCPECDYGHGATPAGKSRQSVTKHWNSKHSEETETSVVPPLLEADKEETFDPDSGGPDWLRFDETTHSEQEPETVSVSPLASTLLRGMVSDEAVPKSAKALKEYYQQQGKLMRWIFSGFVDPLMSWYGRGVTGNTEFSVERSANDWTLFEDASSNWLEYRGISVPVTPDFVMAGTIATFYAPVVVKIHNQRDPARPSLFKKWKTRRALRKVLAKSRAEGVNE